MNSYKDGIRRRTSRLLVTDDRNLIDLHFFKHFKCAGSNVSKISTVLSYLLRFIISHNTKKLHPSDFYFFYFSQGLSNNPNVALQGYEQKN